MILALRTDSNLASIYLLADDGETVKEKEWQADRTLAKSLLKELSTILDGDFQQLTGLIVFSGPGSFTGLRIGITVANTVAYSESIPVVGLEGSNWLRNGVKRLKGGENDKIVVPNYGRDANITTPKK